MCKINLVYLYCCFSLSAIIAGTSDASVVSINPSKDNSIYSESNNSNGGGALFVGRTSGGQVRRSLLQFDIAGAGIPSGSTINSVTLSLTLNKVVPGSASTFELHPLNAAWGEGTAVGPGSGALPGAGDATWNFRLYNTTAWSTAGGSFGATSGTTTFDAIGPTYQFVSQAGMVADVQQWLNSPSSNFGWLMKVGDETTGVTAEALASREFAGQQPTLSVNFTPGVPEPTALGLLGLSSLALLRRRES